MMDYLAEGELKLRCFCGTSKCTGFIGGEKKEEPDNRKNLKKKKKSSANPKAKPATQKVPAKSLLDLTEPDPMNAMLNSLACESDENN
jgi:hypothetical protein